MGEMGIFRRITSALTGSAKTPPIAASTVKSKALPVAESPKLSHILFGSKVAATAAAATPSVAPKPESPRPATTRPYLDPHGQPFNVLFNRARRTERDLSELLGLAKAMLSDGAITEAEAKYLNDWGGNHPDALEQWPTNKIFDRLQHHFADGRIDEAERLDLHELLSHLVGGTASLVLGYEGATTLPLDTPAPVICWGCDEVYVFTGRFAYGTRADCEREVTTRGARCEKTITKRTTCMVIGTFASRDWAHTSYGRKIQYAVKLRDAGSGIRIVGEDHWANALTSAETEEHPF